jgi:vacuolar-type H+-ATPase subunit I/STV1
MKVAQMDDEIRKIYADLVDKTKPELKRYKCTVSILSGVVFLVILGVIIQYWMTPNVAHSTSISIGGLLCSLYGALLLAIGALSSSPTLGLMCITFAGGNPKLFVGLMKSRFSALVGVYFIVGGFAIQAAVMLAFRS